MNSSVLSDFSRTSSCILMMLLYSGCRKVTGEIEIKPDKTEFPASGGRAVIKITKGSVIPCEIGIQYENLYVGTITWCRVESETPNENVTQVTIVCDENDSGHDRKCSASFDNLDALRILSIVQYSK